MAFNPSQARDSNGKWSNGIIDSIEHQMRAKGKTPEEAHALAIEIGQTHGFLDAKGNMTAKGLEREAMGHKGRMIDRAAKQFGKKPSEIGIQNNRAYVK
jgi:hypothetical protein